MYFFQKLAAGLRTVADTQRKQWMAIELSEPSQRYVSILMWNIAYNVCPLNLDVVENY